MKVAASPEKGGKLIPLMAPATQPGKPAPWYSPPVMVALDTFPVGCIVIFTFTPAGAAPAEAVSSAKHFRTPLFEVIMVLITVGFSAAAVEAVDEELEELLLVVLVGRVVEVELVVAQKIKTKWK